MQEINELFKEKLKTEKVQVKEKKKKKEKIVLTIEEKELKYYDYITTENDIKIYDGVIKEERQFLLDKIDLFQSLSDGVLSKLEPSTLTARGSIKNVSFNEETLIEQLSANVNRKIIKVGCNYGEIYQYPNPYYTFHIGTIIKSVNELTKIHKPVRIICQCSAINVNLLAPLCKFVEEYRLKFDEVKIKVMQVMSQSNSIKKKIKELTDAFNEVINFKVDNSGVLLDMINSFSTDDYEFCQQYVKGIQDILNIFQVKTDNCLCISTFPKVKKITQNLKIKTELSVSRGRKVKKIKKNKRKIQGTGLYFNSQTSFDIYSENSIFKIKIFRNGNFQIPGIRRPDMKDIINPLNSIVEYLSTSFGIQLKIEYLVSVMRNYTAKLVGNYTLLLHKLEDVMQYEKEVYTDKNPCYIRFLGNLVKSGIDVYYIFKFLNLGIMQISEIVNNCERYPGIIIKFNKPLPFKKEKKVTIKILSSGKINFDGANSELEVLEMYYWLSYIIKKYWKEIVYDNDSQAVYISDDSGEYESLYDN